MEPKYFKETQPVYFEVGDTVYHNNGKGVVKSTTSNCFKNYPIHVLFNEGTVDVYVEFFTFDGREHEDGPITLSQEPLQPIVNTPKVKFEKGELVWVKFFFNDKMWQVRFYSHKDTEGVHYCFPDQKVKGKANPIKLVRKFSDIPF